MEYEPVIKCYLSQHHKKGQVHFTMCVGVTPKSHWGNVRPRFLNLVFIDDLHCVYLIVICVVFLFFGKLRNLNGGVTPPTSKNLLTLVNMSSSLLRSPARHMFMVSWIIFGYYF